MNKYQEAFDNIANIVEDEDTDGYNQPRTLRDYHCSAFDTLQELIDKSTPKKVIKVSETERIKRAGYTHKCPVCESSVGTITTSGRIEPNNYCCFCGQRLWWFDE